MKRKGYVGTYSENNSKGIYSFDFDNGILSNPKLFCEIKNSKYLAKYKDKIISVCDFDNGSGISLIDTNGKILDEVAYENKTSCYIDSINDYIYTTNYHEGTISSIISNNNKLIFNSRLFVKEFGGLHQVLFYQNKLLVTCLFLDEIKVLDRNLHELDIIKFPSNFGPRHGVFTSDNKYLYVIGELSNQLACINMETLKIENIISVLENNEINYKNSAAIRISADDALVYVSTREKNIISVIEVDRAKMHLVKTISSFGDHPRDFILVDDYLLIANRKSNQLVSYSLKEEKVVSVIEIIEGVSIIMEDKHE